MIDESDRKTIDQLAEKYQVRRLMLFGSGTLPGNDPNDLDLAVEGLAPQLFFQFYSDLAFALSKPVDLVDLSRDTLFNRLIRREGITLYGQSS